MASASKQPDNPNLTVQKAAPPESAAIVPLEQIQPKVPQPIIDPAISIKLKNTREQKEVVGPVVQYLASIRWHLDQLEFGKREWRVPKSPSEATKRERGHSYEGFPCDIAVFDSPERCGDPHHLLMIIEAKTADESVGVNQLETYMGLEPHTKVGLWINTGDPSANVVYVFRNASGQLVRRRRLLADIPRPGEAISEEQKRLTFDDLTVPSALTG